jgi:type III secretion system FlhB-like substrate exporter
VFVRGMGVVLEEIQEEGIEENVNLKKQDDLLEIKNKKGKGKNQGLMEGTRKSPRLEATEDVKIAEKTINRAEAKYVFLNQGNNHLLNFKF